MTFGMTPWEHLMMAASANTFYIAINRKKNKTNVRVAASNINIKIYQLFSKQRVLGARVTTVQGKISVNLELALK